MYILSLKGNKISQHNQFSAYLNNHGKKTQKKRKSLFHLHPAIFHCLSKQSTICEYSVTFFLVPEENECLRNAKRRHIGNNKERSKETMEKFWKRRGKQWKVEMAVRSKTRNRVTPVAKESCSSRTTLSYSQLGYSGSGDSTKHKFVRNFVS